MPDLRSIFVSNSRATYDLVPSDDLQTPHSANDSPTYRREKTRSQDLEAPRSRHSHVFTLAAGLLVGVILGATGMAFLHPFIPQTPLTGPSLKSFAPEMPMKTVVFEDTPELVDPPNEENQKYWDSLLPVGRGFVNISNPEEYGFEPGIPTDSGVDRFSVAMFHQLHCVGLLRFAYWRLMSGLSGEWTDAEREIEHKKQLHDHHTQHCFAYITESIKCAGDMTIEWARIERDGSRRQVDGWGIPHQCKDPEAIWTWVESIHGPTKGNNVHLHGLTGVKEEGDKPTRT